MIDAPPAAVAPWEAPQQLVRLPDGRRLNLYCTGTGAPTVLLESGWGATIWAWAKAQPLIARTNRVCSYDRAGMGFSDMGPLPRDGAAIVRDLAALLDAAKLRPPYVLVGHSAGAMTMRLFADARPRDVVGLVLVDPSVEGQFDGQEAAVAARVARLGACAAAAEAELLPSREPGLAHCSTPLPATLRPGTAQAVRTARLHPRFWLTQASEYESIAGATTAELRAGQSTYGDLPLVVLTAGQSAERDPRWVALHQGLAARSQRGIQRTVAGASHNLMNDAPEAVAAAVAEVQR